MSAERFIKTPHAPSGRQCNNLELGLEVTNNLQHVITSWAEGTDEAKTEPLEHSIYHILITIHFFVQANVPSSMR